MRNRLTEYFTDIHCHILPGVDDGAENIEISHKLLEMEYESGIRSVIFTPHYVVHGSAKKNIIQSERIREAFLLTEEKCREWFPDMELYLGNELFYSEGIINELREHRANTMAGGRCTLVEFAVGTPYNDVRQGLRKIIFSGYKPILAHMERYRCVREDMGRLEEFKNMGCLIQTNAENFLEGRLSANKRFCLKAIKEGYVDFLGTDCHNCTNRRPNMGEAVRYLRKKLPNDLLKEILYENPRCITEQI